MHVIRKVQNEYQRKSYSDKKKVSLCKSFTICTTDGFVVDMLDPYLANQNDAAMKDMISEPNSLCRLMKPGDTFVSDRGFRDVKDELKTKGYRVMPLKGKRNQLIAEESNISRFVTKICWPVKAVHGNIKQKYQLLDKIIDNNVSECWKLF